MLGLPHVLVVFTSYLVVILVSEQMGQCQNDMSEALCVSVYYIALTLIHFLFVVDSSLQTVPKSRVM